MAHRRMVPTAFFRDPDIINLQTRDTQLILIGLNLMADDEGRGVAHAQILGRDLAYPPETIEQALGELAENRLIVLYQVGKHRYYSLTKWWDWQTIPPSKRVASTYPAPPEGHFVADHEQHAHSERADESLQERSAFAAPAQTSRSTWSAQENQENQRKEKGNQEGEEEHIPANVVPFPGAAGGDIDTASENGAEKTQEPSPLTRQIATLLKLPSSEALERLVATYQQHPSFSLIEQADAAREWIDQHTGHMSLAFFQRWLRREEENARARKIQQEQHFATGTAGPERGGAPPAYKNLMNLATEYQEEINQGKELQHG